MTDISNWDYYYKMTEGGILNTSNMLYTPKVNKEQNVLCMEYSFDKTNRKNDSPIDTELLDWFFQREVKFLTELQQLKTTPTVYDIDLVNKRVFIEWNKETLSQIIYTDRSLDSELPDWKQQIKEFLVSMKTNEFYKMALYPHCFFIDKNKILKTIDYYSVVPYSERYIDRTIIEGIIGKDGAYRFDESTNNGTIDFKQFFEITVTRHLKRYWPDSPFMDIFNEVYNEQLG